MLLSDGNDTSGRVSETAQRLATNGFDAVVRIVLHGSFHATLAVGRRMIETGRSGAILNILTPYAWTGSAFVELKRRLLALVEAARAELVEERA